MGESEIDNKHCQRHNGPRGWVLSSKYLHQVISQVDQNSKSQPNICLKVLTISRPQSLDQNQGSNSLPNLSFKTLTKLLTTLSSASTSATLAPWKSLQLASSKARIEHLSWSLMVIVHKILNSSSKNLEFQLSECQIQFLIQTVNRVAEWDSEKSFWNPVGYRKVLSA